MIYRIRYHDGRSSASAEATVEANNPTEAMVKFRHTRGGVMDKRSWQERITSVVGEQQEEEMPWPNMA